MAERGQTETNHLTGVILPSDQPEINSAGVTPLMLACYNGEVGRIYDILQTESDTIQAVNSYDASALDYAVDNNQVQVVDILLGFGADLDALNHDGQSILHRCVLTGELDKVETCVQIGANLDLRNRNGETALHTAIQKQLTAIVWVLLKNACDTTARNQEGLTAHECVFIYLSDNLEIQRALCSDSFDPLVCNEFLYACGTGNVFQTGALISEYGEQIVHSRGIKKVTPVYIASQNGHLNVLRILCRYSPNVNMKVDDWDSPLNCAAMHNHNDIVQYLITEGARVNYRDVRGHTALHIATGLQNREVVKTLVTNGTLINLRSVNGSTALYIATEQNLLDIIKYLVEHGAQIDAANENGLTPLMIAVTENNVEIIHYLIEHGANIEKCNCFQHTPLSLAVNLNKLAAVQHLVEHGADTDSMTPEGVTLPEYALRLGNHEIYKYLTENHSRPPKNTRDYHNDEIFNMSDDLSFQQHLFNMVHNGSGTHEGLKQLIQKEADINGMDSTGRTPLITAIVHSHLEHIEWLIHEQVNVNLADSSGCPPLIHAVLVDSLAITDLLLKHNLVPPSRCYAGRVNSTQSQAVDLHPTHIQTSNEHIRSGPTQTIHQQLHIDQTDFTGKTALSHCAESQHKFADQIATKLIHYGANVNMVDNAEQTILGECIRWGRSNMVNLLLVNGAQLLPFCPGLLTEICFTTDAQLLGLCITHLLALNTEMCGPYIDLMLNFAAANLDKVDKGGFLDILNDDLLCQMITFLTPGKLRINRQDENESSLVMTAAGTAMLELVWVLLERKVDLKLRNQHVHDVVHLALKKGQYETITALVSFGPLELESSDVVIITPGADLPESVKEYNRDIQVEPHIADLKSLWAEALELVYKGVISTFIRHPERFVCGISRGLPDPVLYIHAAELDSDQCERYINDILHIEMYRIELLTAPHVATPLMYTETVSYREQQYSLSAQSNTVQGLRGYAGCVFKNRFTGAYWALTTADAVLSSLNDDDHIQPSHQLLDLPNQLQKAYVIKNCCGLKSVNVGAVAIEHINVLRQGDLGLHEFVFCGNDSTLLQRKVTNSVSIQGLGEAIQGMVIDVNVSFQDQQGQFHHGAFVVSTVDHNQVFAEYGQSGAAVVDTDSGIVLGLAVAEQQQYLGHYKHVTFCLRLDHALMELYETYKINLGRFRALDMNDGKVTL